MKALYKIINWYTQHFRFPFRGWKYFRSFLHRKKLDTKTYCKKLHNGLRMFVTPSDHIQQQIFWYGYYEKNAVLTWETLVNNDSTILDIGANTGYYSLIAAAKAKQGRVYSFEPSSSIREELQKNILLNKLNNVFVSPLAISDKKEDLTLFISNQDNTGMSGLKPAENFSGNTETVGTISIDEWMRSQNIQRLDIIKIDVEGAEFNVLEGMKETLQWHRPVIFMEIRSELLAKFQRSPADIYLLLRSFEYNACEIVKPNRLTPVASYKEGDSILFSPRQFVLPANIRMI